MKALVQRRAAALTLAMAALGLAGCDRLTPQKAVSFHAVDITGADYGKTMALPDLDGRSRTLADFHGKVAVVFFGFTQCPDVCPTTMAELAQVKKALGPDGDRVQGVFITVDPDRDTPDLLKAYVAAFDPTFVALRGNAAQTLEAAKSFKVFYAKVPGKAEGAYTIEHTAGSYIVDPTGRVRLFTRYGSGAAALTDDLKLLLQGR